MLQEMVQLFNSAFSFPGHSLTSVLAAIVLGIVLGAIWLALYRPPLFKKPWLWVVAIASAIITWTACAFVQHPLVIWTKQAGDSLWNPDKLQYIHLVLLVGIPLTLITGIVQEAAKLVPVYFYWWRSKKSFTPLFGLITGAVSGAGFGIFEAIWKINNHEIILSGLVSVIGHTSLTALVGYGLAKRRGWLFYLIAAFLHGLANYAIVLKQNNRLTLTQETIWAVVVLVLIGAVSLWLRWHKTKEISIDNTPAVTPDTTP
jgi:RsiW-degrading membrane proteinase PrsW (M82 family)